MNFMIFIRLIKGGACCSGKLFLAVVCLAGMIVTGCDNQEVIYEVVEAEYTLQDMVRNSDLIAVVEISGGAEQYCHKMPSVLIESVDAKIRKVVCGKMSHGQIAISSMSQSFAGETSHSIIILRNGIHLAFLRKNRTVYAPTTPDSLMSIFKGKIDPVWKQELQEDLGISEYNLEQAVKDIGKIEGCVTF